MNEKEFEEKFIVFNHKDLKYLTKEANYTLGVIDKAIQLGRVSDNKKQINKYYVCNQDESYAQAIIDIILTDGQWIEQQIKDARIDENQKHIDYLIERNREGNFIILQGYFENRVEELKNKRSIE